MRSASTATTRTATRGRVLVDRAGQLLPSGLIVLSPDTGLRYRVERLIGQGGYGQVFLATRLGRSANVPVQVCIKASLHLDGWLREAYFGLQLEGNPRVIQIYDRFPLTHPGGVVYCLALEFARGGDLSRFLGRTGKKWPEATARREIAGILEVLGKLHRGQLLHRDLTPLNVFVCDRGRLKLGDFGIARHQSDRRGVKGRTMNPHLAPSDIFGAAIPRWQARDDVYQVGQLLAMLIKGDAAARVPTREVRQLDCSDQLKEIIHRCIGERRKRYESANELIEALSRPPARLRAGVVRTLKGVHLAFTGFLSTTRSEAAAAARKAGAVVHGGPSAKTSVIVRGRPNAQQAAGRDAGLKLMEARRLREKGHRITVLNETQFWRLVKPEKRR